MDMVQAFWVNITPQLHVVFFRLAYKSRASKNKNWRGRNFKTYKKYFKNNDEKLEHLNSFQKFIFNQQSAAPHKVSSEARGPPEPPLLHHCLVLKIFFFLWQKESIRRFRQALLGCSMLQ